MYPRTEMKCVRCSGFSSSRVCWNCSNLPDAVTYSEVERLRSLLEKAETNAFEACEKNVKLSQQVKELEQKVEAFEKLYRRAYNCAAGYSNHAEECGSTRKLDKELSAVQTDYFSLK